MNEDKPWTTTHGHFLQMRGFQLHTTACENMFTKKSTVLHRRYHFTLILNEFVHRPDGNGAIEQKIREQFRKVIGDRYPNEISEDDAARVRFGDDILEGVLTFDTLKKPLSENLITFPVTSSCGFLDNDCTSPANEGVASRSSGTSGVRLYSKFANRGTATPRRGI